MDRAKSVFEGERQGERVREQLPHWTTCGRGYSDFHAPEDAKRCRISFRVRKKRPYNNTRSMSEDFDLRTKPLDS